MVLSSIFGAKQRICEPLSALAFLTGRHREIKHPRPKIRKCNAGLTRSGSGTKSTVYNSRKSRALIAQANRNNLLCKIGDGENVVTELTRQHLDRTTTPRASESWQRVVSFLYGIIGSYTLQWAVPSLIARPETLIHGREVRVNTDPKSITIDRIRVRPTVNDIAQLVYSWVTAPNEVSIEKHTKIWDC